MLVSKLRHGVGGYKETIPSHHSSFASRSHAPPSNPPHNLPLQLELASHAHLLCLPLAVMDFCLIKHPFPYLSFCLPLRFSDNSLQFDSSLVTWCSSLSDVLSFDSTSVLPCLQHWYVLVHVFYMCRDGPASRQYRQMLSEQIGPMLLVALNVILCLTTLLLTCWF